jgi:hypothetical protein
MSLLQQQSMLQAMFLEDLEQYFADVVGRRNECFEDDAEYMKTVEYKFLLKK